MFSIEHFIDEPSWANVLQIGHLEGRPPQQRDMHLRTLLGVKVSLDAIVGKGYQACRHNNTIHMIS